jgi:hypothetical protein
MGIAVGNLDRIGGEWIKHLDEFLLLTLTPQTPAPDSLPASIGTAPRIYRRPERVSRRSVDDPAVDDLNCGVPVASFRGRIYSSNRVIGGPILPQAPASSWHYSTPAPFKMTMNHGLVTGLHHKGRQHERSTGPGCDAA